MTTLGIFAPLKGNATTNLASFQVQPRSGIQGISGTLSMVNDGGNRYLTYTPSSFQPVPAPFAAVSLGIGGCVGLLGTVVRRWRRPRKSA